MDNNKLTIKAFLDLVSWNTLTASIFPFLVGLIYSLYVFHSVNIKAMIIYLLIALGMDLAVNILDNLNDYDVAKKQKSDNLLVINPIEQYSLSKKQVISILIVILIVTGALGLYLVSITDIIVLCMGIIGILVTILYSLLIQNLPISELVVGFTMGGLIPFAAIYINDYQQFTWSFSQVGSILLLTLPNMMWIANMLLANNICDLDYDKQSGRKTYPIVAGRKQALGTFHLFNIIAIVSILLAVVLKIVPWTMLLIILLIPYIYKQSIVFQNKQVKEETFLAAVKILSFGSILQILSLLIGIVL